MDALHPQDTPRILGLTGPIGCGKTTVGNILLELGAIERIDADRVVHTLLAPHTETTRKVERRFGADILSPDGSVDRRQLGAIVFDDSAALRALEAIVHPAVRSAIMARIAELQGRQGVVVVDAVRLLQSDILPLVEEVWLVRCLPEEQLRRLVEVRGMAAGDAARRIGATPDFEHPTVRRVICNSGTIDELRSEVHNGWDDFLRRTVE